MADPTPEDLSALRPQPAPTPSEKEAYEGKIKELQEEIAALKAGIAELKKPKPEPKKKSFNERFSPI
jgi:cell division protein FtsB